MSTLEPKKTGIIHKNTGFISLTMAHKWRNIGFKFCYDKRTKEYLSKRITCTSFYTNIIRSLYTVWYLRFTMRLVNNLLKIRNKTDIRRKCIYVVWAHAKIIFFYPKAIYISKLYMQPTCLHMFQKTMLQTI